MSLRPHVIGNIPVFVMRSIPAHYALHDVSTEYCLITQTGDNNKKLDVESVHHFASHFGTTIKTWKNDKNEFLIQFEE
jgi:hypothetical protein